MYMFGYTMTLEGAHIPTRQMLTGQMLIDYGFLSKSIE
jgi:hypothetical protein